mgnify:CR=1 FL=1
MMIIHAILLAVAPASPLAAQSSPALLEGPADAEDKMRPSPQEILTAYRTAIQKLDSTEMSALFLRRAGFSKMENQRAVSRIISSTIWDRNWATSKASPSLNRRSQSLNMAIWPSLMKAMAT